MTPGFMPLLTKVCDDGWKGEEKKSKQWKHMRIRSTETAGVANNNMPTCLTALSTALLGTAAVFQLCKPKIHVKPRLNPTWSQRKPSRLSFPIS
jgi:hypothetical protein